MSGNRRNIPLMAKSKKKNNKNAQRRRPRISMAPAARVRTMLDSQAVAYRNLLLDPCNANFAHPVYAGGTGGILCRFTSTVLMGNLPGETGFIFHWTPGCMTTGQDEITVTGFANPSLPTVAVGNFGSPGKDFLPVNATNFRCVSACATLTYVGSELNRSGSVWFGQTVGQLCNIGTAYVGIDMPKSLPKNIRTPDSSVDVIWRPGTSDEDYSTPQDSFADDPTNKDDRGAITIVATGLPPAVGLQIRLTAVYEYQPRYNTGMTIAANARSTSNNTLNQVLNTISDHAWSRIGSAAEALGTRLIKGASTQMMSTGYALANRVAPMLLTM